MHLEYSQSTPTVKCNALIKSDPGGSQAAITIHITDRNFAKIIQVVPKHEAFIGGSPGTYRVELSVVLPPLIPGFYYLDFWLGRYNVVMFDRIEQAVTFEIVDSPVPYHLGYEPIAAFATVNVSKVSVEPRTGYPN